jgi:hypothetical protein
MGDSVGQPACSSTTWARYANDLSRFGGYIGMSVLPGDRDAVRRSAGMLQAPDDVLADLDMLPEGVVFHTVTRSGPRSVGARPNDRPGPTRPNRVLAAHRFRPVDV